MPASFEAGDANVIRMTYQPTNALNPNGFPRFERMDVLRRDAAGGRGGLMFLICSI
jgi:hypothetical protein